ncbi:MAG: hypothetical protein EOP56_11430 [Sphingobacteriales bacterium]|nr:MAG: hypothetical protein EOP56_11430 [Sphingobacteriales bacterium]
MKANQTTKKKIGVNTLVSWGASIVIIGLMFKILHWKGGEIMIAAGLITEAILFGLLGYTAMSEESAQPKEELKPVKNSTNDLENLLATTIDVKVIERLKIGFDNFNKTVESVNQIAGSSKIAQGMLTEVETATEEIKKFQKSLADLNSVYKKQVDSVAQVSSSAQAAEGMSTEVKTTTEEIKKLQKNLSDLNNVYKAQLDAFRKN